ncbi:MAG: sugar ABC transporter permease [Chloroflexi bacterium RBG_16_52_11]|nr:MAG: sugar ABC transporter permease [Chloroflexi bacterium RBG_16_52_11]
MLLLLLPSVVIILLVIGFPMLYSLYISFTNFNLTSPKVIEFIGFENYITLLFEDSQFWKAFGRTVLFITLAVNIELILGLVIAQMMARLVRGKGLARTLMMMPMMFAPILVGFQFKWFFDAQLGLVNNLLYTITGEPQLIPWLIKVPFGFISILIAEIWMSTPFMVIILEAGILSLPTEPFEAAEVDGASGWQKFRLLTLPMIMPFIYTALAIRSLDLARAYDVVSIMTGGGPANRTELIWTYVNRLAFSGKEFALGSAMSFIAVILSLVFTYMFFNNVLKSRWTEEVEL